ncbi:hypothetical protein GCM10027051_27990 [Niabella terrae]
MACSIQWADKVRTALSGFKEFQIEEKRLFGGLAFLVNGKMCINVSEDKLMCRFDPARTVMAMSSLWAISPKQTLTSV